MLQMIIKRSILASALLFLHCYLLQAQTANTTNNDSTNKVNNVSSAGDVDATFPGGFDAWFSYLRKSIDPDIATKNGAPTGTYKVTVGFTIGPDGSVTGAKAATNFGYGMESAVIKAFKRSPKWIPAKQNGKNVIAYKVQALVFAVPKKK
ncbi:MAG TPA: energy transducer TonB [Ferruginibacter sp.]|nr:energy transducer TonB [Ferruginibacter sp.]